MFHASFGSDLKGPFRVQVHAPDDETAAMLVIQDSELAGDFTMYRIGAYSLAEFLAIGRSIVCQCENLMAGPADGLDEILDYATVSAEQTPYAIDAATEKGPEDYF